MDANNNQKQTILREDPGVFYISNFLSDDECQHIIDVALPCMKQSLVSDNNKGSVSNGRTSNNAWIRHNHDDITLQIAEKISKIVNIPLQNAEAYQVIHYKENGEYRSHYDSWEHDNSEKTLRCMKYGGARLKTALVYLNTVEEGGSTKFPKLNISVSAEKGTLLIFENTYKNTNIRHPLSEHAGMPVIKGEKYAFNLWFRESNSKKLYSEFNPDYYNNSIPKPTPSNIVEIDMKPENTTSSMNISEPAIKQSTNTTQNIPQTITEEKQEIQNDGVVLLSPIECSFLINYIETSNILKQNGKYISGWLSNYDFPSLIKSLSSTFGLNESELENMNVYKYEGLQCHGPYIDAYDLTKENTRKYVEKGGQRMTTLCLALSNQFEINFLRKKEVKNITTGSGYIIQNVDENSQRDILQEKRVINSDYKPSYMLYLHVRRPVTKLPTIQKEIIQTAQNIPNKETSTRIIIEDVEEQKEVSELENYQETLQHVLQNFENGSINERWRNYKSFCYNLKGPFQNLKNSVLKFKTLAESEKGLNRNLLLDKYHYDEFTPVKIENTVHPEMLQVLQEYYDSTINSGVFALGDRQSNRFKQHNEPFSRFLHYEILPLVEAVHGKPMKPSYTYLSAYVKESDLPPHTDRPECECTVSFVVNKPDELYWPIYFHKEKQPVKYKGRTYITVDKKECIPIDCDAGGMMMFDGTDHLHFREPLEGEFYHILLLHYMSV